MLVDAGASMGAGPAEAASPLRQGRFVALLRAIPASGDAAIRGGTAGFVSPVDGGRGAVPVQPIRPVSHGMEHSRSNDFLKSSSRTSFGRLAHLVGTVPRLAKTNLQFGPCARSRSSSNS